MSDDNVVLPGLPPVCGKPIQLAFDGGRLTSDAGVLLLAEVERRLRSFREILIDEGENGPLGFLLRGYGPVEAGAVALDRLGISPRTTTFNLLRDFRAPET